MSDGEKSLLRQRATANSFSFETVRELGGMLLSAGSVLVIVILIAWLVPAWIVRLLFEVDYGWNHPWRPAILWVLIAAILAYTTIEVLRASRPGSDERRKLLQDVENGVIEVIALNITEVKVLQEPEHGGLFYFLRTDDDQVFAMFDSDSQDLGAGGEEPFDSSFSPKTNLRIERTPIARFPLKETFSGDRLAIPDVLPMVASPSRWPEPEQFLGISWEAIEATYCA